MNSVDKIHFFSPFFKFFGAHDFLSQFNFISLGDLPKSDIKIGWNNSVKDINLSKKYFDSLKKYGHEYFLMELILRNLTINHENVVYLHGSCVSDGRQAYLILGKNQVGKTTTCLKLLKENFLFISEDLLQLIKIDKTWKIAPFSNFLKISKEVKSKIGFKKLFHYNKFNIKETYLVHRDCIDMATRPIKKIILLDNTSKQEIKPANKLECCRFICQDIKNFVPITLQNKLNSYKEKNKFDKLLKEFILNNPILQFSTEKYKKNLLDAIDYVSSINEKFFFSNKNYDFSNLLKELKR